MTLLWWNVLSGFVLLLTLGWFLLQWKKVETELGTNSSPSGARSFMKLFLAALFLMFAVLGFMVFTAPWIAGGFTGLFDKRNSLSLGELVNEYSTGLSFMFSIPTALAGSVVAILLALRALRSSDDIKELTSKQTELMQEQNALQDGQIALGRAQAKVEQRQAVLREVNEIHRLYFELCDSISGYSAAVRRVALVHMEFGAAGVSTDQSITTVTVELFIEFDEARRRLEQALKSIAASPAGYRLWKELAKSQKSSLMEAIELEMGAHSLDSRLNTSLSDLPALVYYANVYCQTKTRATLDTAIHAQLRPAIAFDSIWRSAYACCASAPLIAAMDKSIYRSDGKDYSRELERLERLMDRSWECVGTSGSYLEALCIPLMEKAPPVQQLALFELLKHELQYVPTSLPDFENHLAHVSLSINTLIGSDCVDHKKWADAVFLAANSTIPDLDSDIRPRAYLIVAGALLACYDGHDYHNLGAALLVDIIHMMPNEQTLASYIRSLFGEDYAEVINEMLSSRSIDLSIRSFLPEELTEAASWILDHPVLPMICAYSRCGGDSFDQLFTKDRWENEAHGEDRTSLLQSLGVNVGGYQEEL